MKLTLKRRDEHEGLSIPWHLLAVVLVVLAPTMVRFGLPFWGLPDTMRPQIPVLAVGYLSAALFITLAVRRFEELPLWSAVPVGAAAFGLSVYFLLVLVGLGYSRIVITGSVAFGIALAIGPHLLSPRAMAFGLLTLTFGAFLVVPWAVHATGAEEEAPVEIHGTALHNLRISYHSGLVDLPPTTGGGIDTYKDGFVVINGIGQASLVDWDDGLLRATPVALPALLNRDAFLADNPSESEGGLFRIMDVAVDSISDPNRLLVSHYHWNTRDRCVSMRLSSISIADGARPLPGAAWNTVFTAEPCIPWDGTTTGLTNHAGGRIAHTSDGNLMLSIGDMLQQGRQGSRPLSQVLESHYGKILILDLNGGVEVLSLGHRNPEGLLVTRDGTIWSTEHGPRGGDELNRIVPGANYGWPFATYGTSNDSNFWPLAEDRQDHGPYEEPAFVWVPSVGVSHLLEVRGAQFPAWEGDLVMGSLSGRSLFRARLRAGRLTYMERIPVDRRVRDMVQDASGKLVLWTDEAEVVVLSNAGDERSGEVVYSQCAVCHAGSGDFPATAPDLRGIIGRRAGSQQNYAYSTAFQELDLVWTSATLDQFLWNPARFAPGTMMVMEGLSDADREAVISFLETYD